MPSYDAVIWKRAPPGRSKGQRVSVLFGNDFPLNLHIVFVFSFVWMMCTVYMYHSGLVHWQSDNPTIESVLIITFWTERSGSDSTIAIFNFVSLCVGCDYLFLPLIHTLKLSPRSAWMTQLRKLVPAVWKIYQLVCHSTGINQSYKSYNALAPYLTIHHAGAEIWLYVCLNMVYCDIKERCILRFCPFLSQHGFLWDHGQMHWGICAIVPS